MDLNETLSELTSLSVPDRLRVVELLWDSIEPGAPISPSPEQRDEINRRIEAHEANPSEVLTWDQVLDRLRKRCQAPNLASLGGIGIQPAWRAHASCGTPVAR